MRLSTTVRRLREAAGHTEQVAAGAAVADIMLYDVAAVAARLSISRPMVYVLLRRGDLASVRIGTRLLVSAAQLRAYVQRLEDEATYGR